MPARGGRGILGIGDGGRGLGRIRALHASRCYGCNHIEISQPRLYAGIGIGIRCHKAGVQFCVRSPRNLGAVDVVSCYGRRARSPAERYGRGNRLRAAPGERDCRRRICGVARHRHATSQTTNGHRSECRIQCCRLPGRQNQASRNTAGGIGRAGSAYFRYGDIGISRVCQNNAQDAIFSESNVSETQTGCARGENCRGRRSESA